MEGGKLTLPFLLNTDRSIEYSNYLLIIVNILRSVSAVLNGTLLKSKGMNTLPFNTVL